MRPITRNARRYYSTKSSKHDHTKPKAAQSFTPKELLHRTLRRIEKAERDERVAISESLKMPKTWMGGFTRPTDLKHLYWEKGGRYHELGKAYESPPSAAYQPYYFFLLESRLMIKNPVGKTDGYEHINGICRATDFLAVMRKLNSEDGCPEKHKESMDNAYWPFLGAAMSYQKPVVWWKDGEERGAVLEERERRVLEDGELNGSVYDVGEESGPSVSGAAVPKPQGNRNAKATVGEPEDAVDDSTGVDDAEATSAAGYHGLAAPQVTHLRDLRKRALAESKTGHITQSTPAGREFITALREIYRSHIQEEPFWRPLIAVQLPSRPTTVAVSMLSKAREKGVPFFASIESHDRKSPLSFSSRMRCMRLNRIRDNIINLAELFSGFRGGVFGYRWKADMRGRGIRGEGLDKPLPHDARQIKVMLGNWYSGHKDEEYCYKQSFDYLSQINDALEVSFMDEWGREVDKEGNLIRAEEAIPADPLSAELMPEPGEELMAEEEEEEESDEDTEEPDSDIDESKLSQLRPRERLLKQLEELVGTKKKLHPSKLEDAEEKVRRVARSLGEVKRAGGSDFTVAKRP